MKPISSRWKIVGGGAAAAALGIAGLGFAGSSDNVDLPNAISLDDAVPVAEAADDSAAPEYEIVPAPVVSGDSLDSPFDSADVAGDDADATATASVDSPDGQLAPAGPATGDQQDDASADSAMTASADSADTSFDSAGSSS